jgi:TonB family protein
MSANLAAVALPKDVLSKCPTFTQFVVEQKLKVVRFVAPAYPKELANEVEGHVRLLVTVGMDGGVLHVVEMTSTHPAFSKSAITAVRQWKFEAPDFGAGPTCVNQTIDIDFRHK